MALVTLLAVAACSNGSGGIPVSPTASERPPVATAVLGSAAFFAGHYDRGFGTERPNVIFNGGDPAGWAGDLRWTGWGQPTATAVGKGYGYRPTGGYYKRKVFLRLRATALGPCDGRVGYRWLYVAKAKRPGSHVLVALGGWWGKQSLCEPGGGNKSP